MRARAHARQRPALRPGSDLIQFSPVPSRSSFLRLWSSHFGPVPIRSSSDSIQFSPVLSPIFFGLLRTDLASLIDLLLLQFPSTLILAFDFDLPYYYSTTSVQFWSSTLTYLLLHCCYSHSLCSTLVSPSTVNATCWGSCQTTHQATTI